MLDKNGLGGSPPLTCLLTHCPIVATQIFQIYEILKLPTLQFYQEIFTHGFLSLGQG